MFLFFAIRLVFQPAGSPGLIIYYFPVTRKAMGGGSISMIKLTELRAIRFQEIRRETALIFQRFKDNSVSATEHL